MEVSVNSINFVVIPDTVGSDRPSDVSSSQPKVCAASQWDVPSSSKKDLPAEIHCPTQCLPQMLAAKEVLENEMKLLVDKLVDVTNTEKNLQGAEKKFKSVKKKADQHTKKGKPQNLPANNDPHIKKETPQMVEAKTDQYTKSEKLQNLPAKNDRDKKKESRQMVQAKTDRNARSVKSPDIQQDSEKEILHIHLIEEKCKKYRRNERKTKNNRPRSQIEGLSAPETFKINADFFLKELIQACEMLEGLCNNTISEHPNMAATFMLFARTSPFRARFYLHMAELSFLLTVSLSQLRSALTMLTDTAVSMDGKEVDPKYLVTGVMNLSYTVTLLQFTFRDLYSQCVLRSLTDEIQGPQQAGQTTKYKQTDSKSRIAAATRHFDLASEQINTSFQKINAIPCADQMPVSSNTELQEKEAKVRFVLISAKLKTLGNNLLSLIASMKFHMRTNINQVRKF
jgi:hypothetical protein